MLFKASKELIDIFLENGFRDTTDRWYADHAEDIKSGGYDPQKHKLILSVGEKDFIHFDYYAICPCYNNCCDKKEIKYALTEEELKSVLTFYRLPAQVRTAYKRQGRIITELYKDYRKICDFPEWYYGQYYKAIKKTFETIVIKTDSVSYMSSFL